LKLLASPSCVVLNDVYERGGSESLVANLRALLQIVVHGPDQCRRPFDVSVECLDLGGLGRKLKWANARASGLLDL
jgi:hypothetical protein